MSSSPLLPCTTTHGATTRKLDEKKGEQFAQLPSKVLDSTTPASSTGISAWWQPQSDSTWVSLAQRARQGRRLRVAIVTENFFPKVDGVTRTLARLLEHLAAEGHEVLVCGPNTGLTSYAGYRVVGTWGIPLVVYPGLKLNFARPKFVYELCAFQPDVVHFIDPIWLGAQMVPLVRAYLPQVPFVASYHTNIAVYANLYGAPWLERAIWGLTRRLHSQCEYTLCPSPSTATLLANKHFNNIALWPRGIDPEAFTPYARDYKVRASWGCIEDTSYVRTPSPDTFSLGIGERSPPPAYDSIGEPMIPEAAFASFALPPPAVATQLPVLSQAASVTACPNNSPSTASSSSVALSVAVLYVGRLGWEKNIRLLIAAYAHLDDETRARAQLVFVGDGPARSALEAECEKLGLSTLFLGHQRGAALAACFASADIFAFPSYTETFGQVVLEALASGLPVVGLAADGTADLVQHGHTGLLLGPDTFAPALGGFETPEKQFNPGAPAFAAAMRPGTATFDRAVDGYSKLLSQLICSPAARASMSQAAAAAASRRSWRDAMDCAVDGYHAALESSRLRPVNDLVAHGGAEEHTLPMHSPVDDPIPATRLLRPRNLVFLTAFVASCALVWSVHHHQLKAFF